MTENYPSDWNRRRQAVYRRDNYQCQNCGRQGGSMGAAELHAHHVVPKSKGGSHKKSNLLTVCRSCHHAIHGDAPAPARASATTSSADFLSEFQTIVRLHGSISETFDTLIENVKRGEIDRDDLADINKDGQEVLRQSFKLKKKSAEFSSSPAVESASSHMTEAVEAWMDALSELIERYVLFLEVVSEQSSDGTVIDEQYEDLLEGVAEAEVKLAERTPKLIWQILRLDYQKVEYGYWDYCPNCGYEESVQRQRENDVLLCLFCFSEWKYTSAGILSKQWEMVRGERSGEQKRKSKWSEIGTEQNEVYENMDAFEKKELMKSNIFSVKKLIS